MPRFSKEFYEKYLLSKQWKQKRLHIFALRHGICDFCHKKIVGEFDVHHKTYAHFTYELDHELMLLHTYCHKKLHSGHKITKKR